MSGRYIGFLQPVILGVIEFWAINQPPLLGFNGDIYILFFETLEINENWEVWEHLVDGLSEKGQNIYLNTWPELKENPKKNLKVKKINSVLREIAISNDKVEILELSGRNGIGATLLDNGQFFLDNLGYQLYKKEILEHIEGKN